MHKYGQAENLKKIKIQKIMYQYERCQPTNAENWLLVSLCETTL